MSNKFTPAIKGGTVPTKQGPVPYLTYAEHDRICRIALNLYRTGPGVRQGRQGIAAVLLDRRQSGAP